MATILDNIIEHKRYELEMRKRKRSLAFVEQQAKDALPVRGFAKALCETLDAGKFALIAEIKKASPSRGIICDNFDPPAIARAYAQGGATCLSVLTDEKYFQGADEYLAEARAACPLPVLRKDFIIDSYQIVESRALAADCVLLIMAALSDEQAGELYAAASEHDMDVLFEVHTSQEMQRAKALSAKLVGINNRNLANFEIDLATTENIAPQAPKGAILVSESGIFRHEDIKRLAAAGARCFLVGESLMKNLDIAAATRELLEGH